MMDDWQATVSREIRQTMGCGVAGGHVLLNVGTMFVGMMPADARWLAQALERAADVAEEKDRDDG